MNPLAILNSQFVRVALPIVITLFLIAWLNNRRFDDMNRLVDEVIKRLDKIDGTLKGYWERIIPAGGEDLAPMMAVIAAVILSTAA